MQCVSAGAIAVPQQLPEQVLVTHWVDCALQSPSVAQAITPPAQEPPVPVLVVLLVVLVVVLELEPPPVLAVVVLVVPPPVPLVLPL
jgi:hypothetical protein